LLANLFMHYAFGTWMDREFPGGPFERCADDIVAHCDSEEQARGLRAAIAARLGALGLELRPRVDEDRVLRCVLSAKEGLV
jgi:RNA-directed DNA polymerase